MMTASVTGEQASPAVNVQEQKQQQKQHGIFICDNVLSVDECNELIAVHMTEHHAGYIDNLTITRFADLATSESIHLTLPVIHARHKCWDYVERCFDQQYELYPEFTSIMGWQKGSYLKSHYDANRDYLQDRHYSAVLYLNDPQQLQQNQQQQQEERRPPTPHEKERSSKIDSRDGCSNKNNNQHQFVGGDLVFELSNDKSSFSSSGQDQQQQQQQKEEEEQEEEDQQREFRVRPCTGRLVCFPSTSDYVHRVDKVTDGSRYALTMWFTKSLDAVETLDSCQQLLFSSSSSKKTTAGLIEQPWETDDQAKDILERYMRHAKLIPKHDISNETTTWIIPCLAALQHHHHQRKRRRRLSDQNNNDGNDNNNRSTNDGGECQQYNEGFLGSISQVELRHLVAYCWWQKDRTELGTITSPDDVLELYVDWQRYKSSRMTGLTSAATRWKVNGMITSVTPDEMMQY